MKSGSKRPMIGPWPCTYACAYINPVFTSQSYDISISTSTRRTNVPVFFVLMLMLMSTQFSLAYTCACACACVCACAYVYVYAPSENQAYDFKFSGKYNKSVGNQTVQDFFWLYFSSTLHETSRGTHS